MSNQKPLDFTLAEQLTALTPGRLPLDVFHAVARLTVTPVLELVPLMHTSEGISVLLTRRAADDPVWPNQLHTPGTVIRADDETIQGALARLILSELPNVSLDKPQFVEQRLHRVRRGTELALIFAAEVIGGGEGHLTSPASHLPDDLVETQRLFIQAAVDRFRPTL